MPILISKLHLLRPVHFYYSVLYLFIYFMCVYGPQCAYQRSTNWSQSSLSIQRWNSGLMASTCTHWAISTTPKSFMLDKILNKTLRFCLLVSTQVYLGLLMTKKTLQLLVGFSVIPPLKGNIVFLLCCLN